MAPTAAPTPADAAEVQRAVTEALRAATPPAAPRAAEPAGGPRLVLGLSRPARLGGVGVTIRFDPARVQLGGLKQEGGLSGFSCQMNDREAGAVRIACVGLPGEDRGGALASFAITGDTAGLAADAFGIERLELVNEEAQALPAELLVVRLEGP